MKILIDPGHGGPNEESQLQNGCAIVPNYDEEDWTLEFSLLLADILRENKHSVELTREDDTALSKYDRWYIGERVQPDIVLSIHVNSLPNSGLGGLMVFTWPRNKVAKKIARLIYARAPSLLRFSRPFEAGRVPLHSKNVKKVGKEYRDYSDWNHVWQCHKDKKWLQRPRRVVGTYSATCLLVEVGYASRAVDVEYLMSDKGKRELASGIAEALNEYFD